MFQAPVLGLAALLLTTPLQVEGQSLTCNGAPGAACPAPCFTDPANQVVSMQDGKISVSLTQCFNPSAISFISVAETNPDGSCGQCTKVSDVAFGASFYDFSVPVGTCKKTLCVYVHDGKYRRTSPEVAPSGTACISTANQRCQLCAYEKIDIDLMGDCNDDKNLCTVGTCTDGACVEVDKDCSDLPDDDECKIPACDSTDGVCKLQAVADSPATPCTLELEHDDCQEAVCVGGACKAVNKNENGVCSTNNSTSGAVGECKVGKCQAGVCVAKAANEGSDCGDADCDGTCEGGECVCGPPPCDGPVLHEECTCDVNDGSCTAPPGDDSPCCEGLCLPATGRKRTCQEFECVRAGAGTCDADKLCCPGLVCMPAAESPEAVTGTCGPCPFGSCSQCPNTDGGLGVCSDEGANQDAQATCGVETCTGVCNLVCGTTYAAVDANNCNNNGGGSCQGVLTASGIDYMGGPCCKCATPCDELVPSSHPAN